MQALPGSLMDVGAERQMMLGTGEGGGEGCSRRRAGTSVLPRPEEGGRADSRALLRALYPQQTSQSALPVMGRADPLPADTLGLFTGPEPERHSGV